jgi:hypothetical protein
MSGFVLFVSAVGLIALCVFMVVMPLLLPWPQRLRYVIASDVSPWAASGWASSGHVLSEATVDYFATDRVLLSSHGGRPARWLSASRPGLEGESLDDVLNLLLTWWARSTPLLVVETGTTINLYGPDGCVTGLVACPDSSAVTSGERTTDPGR